MIARTVPPRSPRTGATLTEVLMALLVMGIGITSVMYIFPLSLLRAIEANKLTNATLLRQNAESRLELSVSYVGSQPLAPGIIEDPDLDGIRSVPYVDGNRYRKSHLFPGEGALLPPNPRYNRFGNFIFDPLGATVQQPSQIGTIRPLVPPGQFPPTGPLPPVPNMTAFGDFNGDGVSDGSDFNYAIPTDGDNVPDFWIGRYTFGLNDEPSARAFVTLPDSFITLADLFANAITPTLTAGEVTGFTVASGSLLENQGQSARVTFIHATTGRSIIRTGTIDSTGSAVTLSAALPTGAGGYDASTIGRVIIELPEQRYTWMATVRQTSLSPSSSPSVTIVVFFRRNFSPEDERVYVCNEPAGSYNEFSFDPSSHGGVTPPGLVAGGWMFDANAFRWWKISSVREQGGLVRFNVDPEEYDPNPQARGPVYAMFPRNVVEAYTLEKD